MWDNFKTFLAKPYDNDMDALHWFLFLGLLIVLMAIWGIILKHLQEAMK